MTEKKTKKKPNVRDKALSLLERMDRTEYQIRLSLAKAEYSESEIDETLEFLKEFNYVDDYAYAHKYLKVLMDKKRGSRRIRDDMRRHGLTPEIIDQVMLDDYSDEIEMEHALDRARKIREGLKPDIDRYEIPKKISLKLLYHGFDYEAINYAISEVQHGVDAEDIV
jgi:regulatory protein